jgi:hypothetical protein
MEIIILVGQSQMSSISTLIEASSSAAVLLGFFMVVSRRGYARIVPDPGSSIGHASQTLTLS